MLNSSAADESRSDGRGHFAPALFPPNIDAAGTAVAASSERRPRRRRGRRGTTRRPSPTEEAAGAVIQVASNHLLVHDDASREVHDLSKGKGGVVYASSSARRTGWVGGGGGGTDRSDNGRSTMCQQHDGGTDGLSRDFPGSLEGHDQHFTSSFPRRGSTGAVREWNMGRRRGTRAVVIEEPGSSGEGFAGAMPSGAGLRQPSLSFCTVPLPAEGPDYGPHGANWPEVSFWFVSPIFCCGSSELFAAGLSFFYSFAVRVRA